MESLRTRLSEAQSFRLPYWPLQVLLPMFTVLLLSFSLTNFIHLPAVGIEDIWVKYDYSLIIAGLVFNVSWRVVLYTISFENPLSFTLSMSCVGINCHKV